MPLLRGGRPLKRWTWVGAFGSDAMLCAAVARIGPVTTSWWAVWDPGGLRERTLRRALDVSATRVRVPGVMSLEVGGGAEVEVVSPHGSQYAWTRKRAVTVRGTVLGRPFESGGLVDESAGYHARHTAWRWSAGVGAAASGEPVAWNLVDGLHDGSPSERTVWLSGEPHEVGPVAFGGPADPADPAGPSGLSGVAFEDGAHLRFTALATRARRENLLIASSDYEQPFGTFAGELPVAGALREGFGVMERHDVRW
jgi:hypothetical protein